MPADSTTALLSATRQNSQLLLSLRGEWDIRESPPGFETLEANFQNGSTPQTISFETKELGLYDSSLISLLLQIHKRCAESGAAFDRDSLPEGINQLLDMALAVPEKRDAHAGTTEVSPFFRIGEASLKIVNDLHELFSFIGECLLAFGRLLRGKARFRRKDFWLTLQECGAEALPIVSLIALMVGMIFGFVGAYQMAGIGTTIFVANLVAIAMVREMGCLMTGIIMSGRTGAAFAAQLGSMKVNQEIDALKTFGFSPVEFLVLPRMLALVIMMPLLTIYANIIGMAGGALVTCVGFDVGFEAYLSQTISVLTLQSTSLGVIKSIVFGVIVAGAGCLRGLESGSSASAVGNAATSAVVVSITAIVIADCIFAVITTILDI